MTTPVEYPGGRRVAAAFTFDVDAESAILFGAAENGERMSVMSHQAYGPLSGVPKILAALERQAVTATFFVPAVTALRYPDVVRSIAAAGHEIGAHGYLHEELRLLTLPQRRDVLLRSIEVLEHLTGARPTAYRAPMWDLTWDMPELLAQEGFLYDSSLMDSDWPYELAAGGSERSGAGASIVELPIQWTLDDWEQYAFLPDITGSGRIATPATVNELWRSELEGMRVYGGLWVLTNHPFLSGRPGRLAVLERLMGDVVAMDDVWTAPLGEIARHVRSLGLAPRSPAPYAGEG